MQGDDMRVLRFILIVIIGLLALICINEIAQGQEVTITVVPAYFSDQSPPVFGPDPYNLGQLMEEVVTYYNVSSYGKLRIKYFVAPPYKIPKPMGTCVNDWEMGAMTAAINAGAPGGKGLYYYNDPNCPFGGEAILGGNSMHLRVYNPQIFEHEIGHSLGYSHNNRLNFPPFAVVGMDQRWVQVYGGGLGVMGGGSSTSTAFERGMLGWLNIRKLGRVVSQSAHLEPLYVAPGDAFAIQREDGYAYTVERRVPIGLDSNIPPSAAIHSNYWYQTQVAILLDGEELNDVLGGVKIRYLGAGDFDIKTFPAATPTPGLAPTQGPPGPDPGSNPGGTPVPTPCFVGGFIRCTPTPTITPTITASMTPTPSPTETPEPTLTPTTEISVSPTMTETPISEPSTELSPTPSATVVPSPSPKPSNGGGGGCRPGRNASDSLATGLLGGLGLLWMRKRGSGKWS